MGFWKDSETPKDLGFFRTNFPALTTNVSRKRSYNARTAGSRRQCLWRHLSHVSVWRHVSVVRWRHCLDGQPACYRYGLQSPVSPRHRGPVSRCRTTDRVRRWTVRLPRLGKRLWRRASDTGSDLGRVASRSAPSDSLTGSCHPDNCRSPALGRSPRPARTLYTQNQAPK